VLEPGTVTQLLGKLRSADRKVREEAAAALWNEYCAVLLDLACDHLSRRLQRRVGADDVVQQTFKSFFLRHQRGQYSLSDRTDLLRLLMGMTLNKARTAAAREGRQRRDFRRDEVPAGPDKPDDWFLKQLEAGLPTPEEALALAEEAEQRLAQLPPDLREVALYKLQGFSNKEIAAMPSVNCAVRTVERKLRLIREAWEMPG
jgi:DNA-directed RNA polymerase specialized sigma24 family protein